MYPVKKFYGQVFIKGQGNSEMPFVFNYNNEILIVGDTQMEWNLVVGVTQM